MKRRREEEEEKETVSGICSEDEATVSFSLQLPQSQFYCSFVIFTCKKISKFKQIFISANDKQGIIG